MASQITLKFGNWKTTISLLHFIQEKGLFLFYALFIKSTYTISLVLLMLWLWYITISEQLISYSYDSHVISVSFAFFVSGIGLILSFYLISGRNILQKFPYDIILMSLVVFVTSISLIPYVAAKILPHNNYWIDLNASRYSDITIFSSIPLLLGLFVTYFSSSILKSLKNSYNIILWILSCVLIFSTYSNIKNFQVWIINFILIGILYLVIFRCHCYRIALNKVFIIIGTAIFSILYFSEFLTVHISTYLQLFLFIFSPILIQIVVTSRNKYLRLNSVLILVPLIISILKSDQFTSFFHLGSFAFFIFTLFIFTSKYKYTFKILKQILLSTSKNIKAIIKKDFIFTFALFILSGLNCFIIVFWNHTNYNVINTVFKFNSGEQNVLSGLIGLNPLTGINFWSDFIQSFGTVAFIVTMIVFTYILISNLNFLNTKSSISEKLINSSNSLSLLLFILSGFIFNWNALLFFLFWVLISINSIFIDGFKGESLLVEPLVKKYSNIIFEGLRAIGIILIVSIGLKIILNYL